MDGILGQIQKFALTEKIPTGFVECDGRVLNCNEHSVLYSLIGNVYGGEAPETFALPDLRPRNEQNELINIRVGEFYKGEMYIKSYIAIKGQYPY